MTKISPLCSGVTTYRALTRAAQRKKSVHFYTRLPLIHSVNWSTIQRFIYLYLFLSVLLLAPPPHKSLRNKSITAHSRQKELTTFQGPWRLLRQKEQLFAMKGYCLQFFQPVSKQGCLQFVQKQDQEAHRQHCVLSPDKLGTHLFTKNSATKL